MEFLILDALLIIYGVAVTIFYIKERTDNQDRLKFFEDSFDHFNKKIVRYHQEIRRLNTANGGFKHPVTGKFIKEREYFLVINNIDL